MSTENTNHDTATEGCAPAAGYAAAIAELRRLKQDSLKNRATEDPDNKDIGWKYFIEGITHSIYRLEMSQHTDEMRDAMGGQDHE